MTMIKLYYRIVAAAAPSSTGRYFRSASTTVPSSVVTHEVILEPLPLGDSRRWASFMIS